MTGIRCGFIAVAGLLLVGCAGGPSLLPANKDLKACLRDNGGSGLLDADGDPTAILVEAAEEAAFDRGLFEDSAGPDGTSGRPQQLEQFLSCYAGKVDPANLEHRLFRGHLIVTMLAMYGEYSIRRLNYDAGLKEADARRLLDTIQTAESGLRLRSNVVMGADGAQSSMLRATALPSIRRVDGLVDVFGVGAAAYRPAANTANSLFRTGLSVATGDLTRLPELFETGLKAAAQSARLGIYGPAGVWDMRWMMACYSGINEMKPLIRTQSCVAFGLNDTDRIVGEPKRYWDRVDLELDVVCGRLNVLAGNSQPVDCTPNATILFDRHPGLKKQVGLEG